MDIKQLSEEWRDPYGCQDNATANNYIDALDSKLSDLLLITERLETLAVKWVDASHHDWSEIKNLALKLDKLKLEIKRS